MALVVVFAGWVIGGGFVSGVGGSQRRASTAVVLVNRLGMG